MFDVIVWATDGSEAADAALAYATQLAAGADGTLVAVHVQEILIGDPVRGRLARLDDCDVLVKIRAQVEEARRAGIDVRLQVVTGEAPRAAHLIADAADKVAADTIVVGAHRHPALSAAAAESVTQRLLQAARCPVLVVPLARRTRPRGERWEPVGVPV